MRTELGKLNGQRVEVIAKYKKMATTNNNKNLLTKSSPEISLLLNKINIDFDYSKLYCFDEDFIRGFYVEYYSTPLKVCTEVAHRIMKNEIEKSIKSNYFGEDVVNLKIISSFTNEIFSHYLLPVYRCDYVFKNKHYSAFINGQNGKVGGFPPKSKLKISLLVISLILLFAGFISLFFIF